MAHNYRTASASDRSIGQLLSDLLRQVSDLVQEELALARTEMSTKLPRVGRSLGMIAGGGALAYAGVLALIAAAIIALHGVMPWWAAALLVGLVVLALGYGLIQSGLQTIKQTNLAPRRTLGSLRGYPEMGRRTNSAFTRQP